MKREIKFRAFVDGIMSEPFTLGTLIHAFNSESNYQRYKDHFVSEHLSFDGDADGTPEYMQFTGLKDKNGKEIYEGDILVIYQDTLGAEKHATGEIKWQYGCFEFAGDNAMGNVHGYDKEYIEIIGNIYENKDLLTNPAQ